MSVSCSVASESSTCKAPLSMQFSRQEYWSGLPFLSPVKKIFTKKVFFFFLIKAGDLSGTRREDQPGWSVAWLALGAGKLVLGAAAFA